MSLKINKKNHQSKRSHSQIRVLYILATNGNQSISSLSQLLATNRTNIASSIKILDEEHYVKFVKKIYGKGSPERLYKITDKGIETLSKDKRITLRQFWEIVFCIFHNKRNQKISFAECLLNYRSNVLQYNPHLIIFGWGIAFDIFELYYKRPLKKNLSIEILQSIALKEDTYNNILEYFCKKQKIKYQKIVHTRFNRLIQDKLILTKSNNNEKYRLSSLGLLLLMNYYRDYLSNISEGIEHKRIGNEVTQIIKNAKNSVPIISEIWEDLTEVIDTSNLIYKFDNITSKNIPFSQSIQMGGIKEILITERIIRETYNRLMNKEYRVGLNVCIELLKQKKIPENSPSEVFDYLRFLGQMTSSIKKEPNTTSKWLDNQTFDDNTEKAISEIISFEFITNVIEHLKNWMSRNNPDDPQEPINDWIESHRKKWIKFLQKHDKMKTWYQNWISEIQTFERKNLEILQDRDFFLV